MTTARDMGAPSQYTATNKADMSGLYTIREDDQMKISDKAAQALYSATVTRGKNKGLLLKNAPRDRLARAAVRNNARPARVAVMQGLKNVARAIGVDVHFF